MNGTAQFSARPEISGRVKFASHSFNKLEKIPLSIKLAPDSYYNIFL